MKLTCALMFVPTLAMAQAPPPASYPIQNRIVEFNYDRTRVQTCDLGGVTPGSGSSGLDNGIAFSLPTKATGPTAVVYRQDIKKWVGDLGVCYNTTAGDYFYYPMIVQPDTTGFYPNIAADTPSTQTGDPHDWFDGVPDPSEDLGAVLLTCKGYDGKLRIAGDMSRPAALTADPNTPGNYLGDYDGILFTLAGRNAHYIGDDLIHLQLWLVDGAGSAHFYWAVYGAHFCDLSPITDAQLASITGS